LLTLNSKMPRTACRTGFKPHNPHSSRKLLSLYGLHRILTLAEPLLQRDGGCRRQHCVQLPEVVEGPISVIEHGSYKCVRLWRTCWKPGIALYPRKVVHRRTHGAHEFGYLLDGVTVRLSIDGLPVSDCKLRVILAFWSGPAVEVNFGPPGRVLATLRGWGNESVAG
jgi:hypothetical protein